MRLTELKVGDCGVITEVSPLSQIYKRLTDIGFTNGSTVKCVLNSPLGEPKAYLIKGTVIALRQENTDEIKVGATSDGTY